MANIPELVNNPNKWGDFTGAFVLLGIHPKNTIARGRVVVTDDPRRGHDLVWLFKMQTRIADLHEGAPAGASPDLAEAGRLMTMKYLSQSAKVGRIPPSLTGGVETYLWDVIVPMNRLPDAGLTKKYRETYLAPCRLGRRGPNGTELEVLPYTRAMRDRRSEQFVAAVRQRGGVRLRAAVVQANDGLFRPGDRTLPAALLFTFERGVPNLGQYLDGLARQAYRIKTGAKPSHPDRRPVYDRLWAGERGQCYYHERMHLPRGFTSGPAVYLASIWMPATFLRGGMIQRGDPLHVLAEPGDAGGAELLPYWHTEASGIAEALPAEDVEEGIPLTEADVMEDVLPEVEDDENDLLEG